MMTQVILDHGVSGSFGTNLAPTTEGARVENPDATETIGRDLCSSAQSQSLTGEPEAIETPIKPHETR